MRNESSSLDLLSKYRLITEFRFDAILCSILGKENSEPGRFRCCVSSLHVENLSQF